MPTVVLHAQSGTVCFVPEDP